MHVCYHRPSALAIICRRGAEGRQGGAGDWRMGLLFNSKRAKEMGIKKDREESEGEGTSRRVMPRAL